MNSTAPTVAPPTVPPTIPAATAADELQDFVESRAAVTIAFICALLAVMISGHNIFKHLVHYSEPVLQKNIVRILLIVPIYAVFSFLSLSIPSGHEYIDIIRDIYEAFVVYCFLNLMLIYCGGENACLSVIMHDPGAIRHVWPFHWCLPEIALTSRFLRYCKQWTLQFVIVKPVMAAINLFMITSDNQDKEGWKIAQAVIYNISYTAALYALVLFYKATHNHPGLKSRYPVLKFLSVKLVVFATYYQTVLVGITPDVPQETLEAFNSFLLCCEMVLFAIIQYCAFSWRPFSGPKQPHIASRSDSAFDSIGIEVHRLGPDTGQRQPVPASAMSSPNTAGGAASEAASPPSGGANEMALSNAKDVISMRDVAKDAYYNFSNKYGDHVLLDTTASQMDDLPREQRDADAPGRRSALGRVGTALKSIRTGGHLAGEDGEDGANPFGDAADEGAAPSPSAKATMDPSLPSYVFERDEAAQGGGSNPFEQDLADPLGIAQPSGAQREEAAQEWTADFHDAGAEKGKGKGRQGGGDDLTTLNLA